MTKAHKETFDDDFYDEAEVNQVSLSRLIRGRYKIIHDLLE